MDSDHEPWHEVFDGGCAETEWLVFQRLAQDIMLMQQSVQRRTKAATVDRAFHAKMILGTINAEFRVLDDVPPELCCGWISPGRCYPALVRFSNASALHQADAKPDFRGISIRVTAAAEERHDLLMTNFPVSYARNARQFVAFAKATVGGPVSTVFGLIGLAFTFGPFETLRMLRNVLQGRQRKVASLALESFWSRGAYCWGPKVAVRFLVRPAGDRNANNDALSGDPDYLTTDLLTRLAAGDVEYTFYVQKFVDELLTPIEDTAVEWLESSSRPIPVACLTLRRGNYDAAKSRADDSVIEELRFNPWNTTDDFRPLGNLNRARKAVYDASAAQRLGYRFLTVMPLRNIIFGVLFRALFAVVNTVIPWHRLPVKLALLNLDGFRFVLRKRNLIDTDKHDAPPTTRRMPPEVPERARSARSTDGTFDDLSARTMGSANAPFGRNLPAKLQPDLFGIPNPVVVADQLLKRERFIPATSLNILAATWIQFQVHDWVGHNRYVLGQDNGAHDVTIAMPNDRLVQNHIDTPSEPVMRIAGNTEPLHFLADGSPVFGNEATHWWDSSELYGSDPTAAKLIRDGAKLRLENGYLPRTLSGQEVTGFAESWWLGLSSMHTLFAREHNVLCDELRREYRSWSDERVFQTARLIVAALIAKIHTIEWTPAILATEVINIGLNANWNGPPSDWLTKLGLWLTDVRALTGIPKTMPFHDGTPYSLTEDFITVYRMHPLIPDDYTFLRCDSGDPIDGAPISFTEIQGRQTDEIMRTLELQNVLYSFGIANPGAITLHNFPDALRTFQRNGTPDGAGDGEIVDLAVVDLIRTRLRGIPRYNDFRAGLHMPRIQRWEDLTANPESVRRLREIYGEIERVDTVVGLLGETPPVGFGFSDTAFRIFILMASRRIQSDRFLTVDFRSEIYSPLGMDWIANNGMTSVILRHCPELATVVPRTSSAFAPWRSVVPLAF